MNSNLAPLLERNRAFAETDTRTHVPRQPFLPHQGLFIVTCMDSRTDPADFLGLRFGEAIVARTVGGRVTPAVIQGVAFLGYVVETKAPEGPYFEVAIIHHTDCGSTLLADEEFRQGFTERTGFDDDALAGLPVLDPAATENSSYASGFPVLDPAVTVRTDVERMLSDPRISSRIAVSGHVYDVDTGLVRTVVEPASPRAKPCGNRIDR
jgi:carbonic anhydrase